MDAFYDAGLWWWWWGGVVVFEQWFLHCALMSWPVPGFFMVSGYFFTKSKYFSGEESYGCFLRKKLFTLGIPYIAFCGLGFLAHLPRFFYEANFDAQLVGARLFENGVGLFILNLIGCSKITPMYDGALWFLKVLFLIFVFGGVLKVLVKMLRGYSLLIGVIGLLVLRFVWPLSGSGFYSNGFYFFFGAAIGVTNFDLRLTFSRRVLGVALVAYVFGAVFETVVVVFTMNFSNSSVALLSRSYPWYEVVCVGIKMLSPLLAIVLVWEWAKKLASHPFASRRFASWSFWLYCCHYLLVMVAAPICHAVFGKGAAATVICSFALFGLYLILSVGLGKVLVCHFPRVAYCISGGRM